MERDTGIDPFILATYGMATTYGINPHCCSKCWVGAVLVSSYPSLAALMN